MPRPASPSPSAEAGREPAPALAEAFAAHRAFLWAVTYRMTGNAADADDLVQEPSPAPSPAPARTDAPGAPGWWRSR